MKTLAIFRHAQAQRPEGMADHDRPLTDKGVREARRSGRLLRGFTPEHVLCSTARRALDTATEALRETGVKVEIRHLYELYDSQIEDHVNATRSVPDSVSRLLVVGHNPTLEQWAAQIAEHPVTLQTGALILFGLPIDSWQAIDSSTRGQVVGLFCPDMLKKHWLR